MICCYTVLKLLTVTGLNVLGPYGVVYFEPLYLDQTVGPDLCALFYSLAEIHYFRLNFDVRECNKLLTQFCGPITYTAD